MRRLALTHGLVFWAIAWATPAPAQGSLGVRSTGGEIGVRLDGTRSPTSAGQRGTGSDLGAWLSVPLSGSVWDSRFLTYQVTLRPNIRQLTIPGVSNGLGARQLGLSFGTQLLPASPVSLGVTGSRLSGITDAAFGGRREITSTSLSANVAWRNRLLPIQATYSRESYADLWLSDGFAAPLRTANDVKSWRFWATNSKLSLLLHRLAYDDRSGGNDHNAWNALASHTIRWGKGSRLESLFDVAYQDGNRPYARRAWSERLRLQHTTGLSSTLNYHQQSTEAGGTTARSNGAGMTFEARLGPALAASLYGARDAARAAGGREATYTLTPRLDINLPGPAGIRFAVGGALGYQTRRRESGTDLLLTALNERHTVGPARFFTLDQPLVDPTTVAVWNIDQTRVYQADIDYRLVPLGDLLRIDALPGGRIRRDEVVLVTYRFRAPPRLEGDVLLADYRTAVQWRGLTLRHERQLRDARRDGALAGIPEVFLGGTDFSETSTSITYRGTTPLGSLDLGARLLRRGGPGTSSASRDLGGNLVFVSTRSLTTSAAAAWNETRLESVVVRSLSASSTAAWRLSSALRFQATLEALSWHQAPGADERFLGGTVEIEWQRDHMSLRGLYRHEDRRVATQRLTQRLALSLVRRF